MAIYANEASVLWLEPYPATPSIDAAVLLARVFPLADPRLVVKAMDRVTVAAPSASRVTLPFTEDVNDESRWKQVWQRPVNVPHPWQPPADPSFSVVVTDSSGGVLFRSPYSATLPAGSPADPNGFIDMLVPPVQVTTLAEINAEIATRVNRGDFNNPAQDPSTVVSSATAALNSGSLTLTVTGTRSGGGFTFVVTFGIEPAAIPFYWAFDVYPTHTQQIGGASLSFTANPGHGVETFLLNLFSGWLAQPLADTVLAKINEGLVESAHSKAAQAAGIPSTGTSPPTLPAEVVLSVRRLAITPTGVGGGGPGIYAWGAIGSFGDLLGHLFPGRSSGRSLPGCSTLALLTPLLVDDEVAPFLRYLRDTTLRSTAFGRN
jgi:hypothetical protein